MHDSECRYSQCRYSQRPRACCFCEEDHTRRILKKPVAISLEAARIKKIKSKVAGDVDLLMVPNLEAGNILFKQLQYLAGALAAGVVVGAKVPIVLTSRADGELARNASCALGVLLAKPAPDLN